MAELPVVFVEADYTGLPTGDPVPICLSSWDRAVLQSAFEVIANRDSWDSDDANWDVIESRLAYMMSQLIDPEGCGTVSSEPITSFVTIPWPIFEVVAGNPIEYEQTQYAGSHWYEQNPAVDYEELSADVYLVSGVYETIVEYHADPSHGWYNFYLNAAPLGSLDFGSGARWEIATLAVQQTVPESGTYTLTMRHNPIPGGRGAVGRAVYLKRIGDA